MYFDKTAFEGNRHQVITWGMMESLCYASDTVQPELAVLTA